MMKSGGRRRIFDLPYLNLPIRHNVMKPKKQKLLILPAPSVALAALALAIAPAHSATVIYADDFSGASGTNLNGQAPDTRPGTETWTASTTSPQWRANGSIANNTANRGAFLPISPTVGNVYTLSLVINSTNNTTDWLAMGFTQGANTTADFFGTVTNAGPWLLDQGSTGNTSTLLGGGPPVPTRPPPDLMGQGGASQARISHTATASCSIPQPLMDGHLVPRQHSDSHRRLHHQPDDQLHRNLQTPNSLRHGR